MRNQEEALALAHRAVSFGSGADQISVEVTANRDDYSRFARNYVVQNIASAATAATVTTVKSKRIGTFRTTDVSDDGLRSAVARALDIASRVPANREFVSLATPGHVGTGARSVFAATSDASPDDRVEKLLPLFARMERSNLSSSGFTTTQHHVFAVANSLGVSAAFTASYGGLEVKAIAPTTSGFAEYFSRDYATLDSAERADLAAQKATVSSEPQDFPPGTYTVVLEPPAFVDCVNSVLGAMDAAAVLEDKSSWMVGRLGTLVLSPNLTIVDDWSHPLNANQPFANDGTPTQKLTLVDAGIPKAYVSSTYLANKLKIPNTGHDGYPTNAVILPGTKSRAELIASVERGILISRTWYTREVDPRECTITGLTRDGVFLIENGKLTKTLKNFRFFTSMLAALSDIELGNKLYLAESADTPGTLAVPDAKIAKFTLSAQTSFA